MLAVRDTFIRGSIFNVRGWELEFLQYFITYDFILFFGAPRRIPEKYEPYEIILTSGDAARRVDLK